MLFSSYKSQLDGSKLASQLLSKFQQLQMECNHMEFDEVVQELEPLWNSLVFQAERQNKLTAEAMRLAWNIIITTVNDRIDDIQKDSQNILQQIEGYTKNAQVIIC